MIGATAAPSHSSAMDLIWNPAATHVKHDVVTSESFCIMWLFADLTCHFFLGAVSRVQPERYADTGAAGGGSPAGQAAHHH